MRRGLREEIFAALSTPDFQRRFRSARPQSDEAVEELARQELKRQKVDLSGVDVAFVWDPGEQKLTLEVETVQPTQDRHAARLRSVDEVAPEVESRQSVATR